LQDSNEKSQLKHGSKTGETSMEGPSSQKGTIQMKKEEPNSIQNTNNFTDNEERFNGLVISSLESLKVSYNSLDDCVSYSLTQPKPRRIKDSQFDILEMVRQKAEVKAATVSLKTNLVLGVSIIVIFICFMLTSRTLNIIITTFLKGLIPIVTAISNFVKIQDIIKLYWNKFNPFCFLK
jgi:hypothetical protein